MYIKKEINKSKKERSVPSLDSAQGLDSIYFFQKKDIGVHSYVRQEI
jgi:hypothetical protein